ncbi:MAG: hypothetical protein JSR33_06490 [Proteobacteria bacterium]|nr:hypothetical protein [Pseudomonadota bacterium]
MKRSKTTSRHKHTHHVNRIADIFKDIGLSAREALGHALDVVENITSTLMPKTTSKKRSRPSATRRANIMKTSARNRRNLKAKTSRAVTKAKRTMNSTARKAKRSLSTQARRISRPMNRRSTSRTASVTRSRTRARSRRK